MATKKNPKVVFIERTRVPLTFRILLVQTAAVVLILFAFFAMMGFMNISFILFSIIIIIVLVINFLLSIVFYYDWKNKEYELHQEGIVFRSGLLHKHEETYPLNNIESITLSKDIIGMYFNYGTIRIYDPALKRTVTLENIRRPEYYQKLFKEIFIVQDKEKSSRVILGG